MPNARRPRCDTAIAELSRRFGLNPKTVAKWKKRTSITDAPMGPKKVRSSVLSIEEEALIVAFRRHILLPLADCLYTLQATIPHLTRSPLHRCFRRHWSEPMANGSAVCRRWRGRSRRRRSEPAPSAFGAALEPMARSRLTPHRPRLRAAAGVAGVRTEEGRLCLLVATDRTRKFACADLGIQRRLTKPYHPSTNGQVGRVIRTIGEATMRRYHYETHEGLRAPLRTVLEAYNFARRLKTIRGLTPFEFVSEKWTSEPHRFRLHPEHLIPGPNG